MRYVALNVKKRLEEQLPVMRHDLDVLKRLQHGLYPIAVHNISLCVEERVYLFIEPVLRMYQAVLPKQKRKMGVFKIERTEDEKQMEKRIVFLDDLLRKEHALYNEQLMQAKADIKREKKEATDEKKADIPSLQERIEFFRHVDIDMYDFILPLMALEGQGKLETNQQYRDLLNQIREIAIRILEEFIPKREKALETAIQVLNAQTEQIGRAHV